jgi:DNA-binding response OmpR family regulator
MEASLQVVVYSDDAATRMGVVAALGVRPSRSLPGVEWSQIATAPALFARLGAGDVHLVILDGESTPAGGLGIARQLKDELANCPPVIVLTGRPQDAWLARWSRAEAAVPRPLDPRVLHDAVVGVLGQSSSRPRTVAAAPARAATTR